MVTFSSMGVRPSTYQFCGDTTQPILTIYVDANENGEKWTDLRVIPDIKLTDSSDRLEVVRWKRWYQGRYQGFRSDEDSGRVE